MYKIMAIVVVILSIGGMVYGGYTFYRSLGDPGRNSLEEVQFKGSGADSQNVTLEEGDYEVWVEGEDNLVKNLSVKDKNGDSVYERNTGHSISINERSYEKMGDVDIEEKGTYTISTKESCTLHVTKPQGSFVGIAKGFGIVLLGILGLVAAFFLYSFSKGGENQVQTQKMDYDL